MSIAEKILEAHGDIHVLESRLLDKQMEESIVWCSQFCGNYRCCFCEAEERVYEGVQLIGGYVCCTACAVGFVQCPEVR